jgi:hypothetical protein
VNYLSYGLSGNIDFFDSVSSRIRSKIYGPLVKMLA